MPRRLPLWLAVPVAAALHAAMVHAAVSMPALAAEQPSVFDPESAIAYSQAAVGRSIGTFAFQDGEGETVRLSDFRGTPLVVNLVFTACAQSCPIVVKSLERAVDVAQEALGRDSFSVVTIGFDTENDTPERMHAYARDMGVALPNWHFLSGAEGDMQRLLEELGFLYYPSPLGFDHLAQTSVLDPEGRVHQQVYGAAFQPPALVEPLKGLLMGRAGGSLVDIASLVERVRLFCTFYDPARDRYSFDSSFFFALAIGGLSLVALAFILIRAWLAAAWRARAGRTPAQASDPR